MPLLTRRVLRTDDPPGGYKVDFTFVRRMIFTVHTTIPGDGHSGSVQYNYVFCIFVILNNTRIWMKIKNI